MPEVDTLFRDADAILAPDQWTEITERAAHPFVTERDAGDGLPRRSWERYVIIAAAPFIGVIALGLIVRAFGPGVGERPAAQGTWKVVDRIALGHEADWAAADGWLWVSGGDRTHGRLWRVDPQSKEIVTSLRLPAVGPAGVVASDGRAIWVVAGPGVVRVDPSTDKVAAEVPLPNVADDSALAVGFAGAWVGEHKGPHVWRVEAATNEVTPIDTGNSWPIDLVATSDAIWLASFDGNVQAIDPTTNEIVQKIDLGAELGGSYVKATGITADAGSVWVTACSTSTRDEKGNLRGCSWSLVRIDAATGRVTDTFDLGRSIETPTGGGLDISMNFVRVLVANGDDVWVSMNDYAFRGKGNPFDLNQDAESGFVGRHSRLIRIDATSGETIQEIPLGNSFVGDAVTEHGALWLADQTHGELIRLERGA